MMTIKIILRLVHILAGTFWAGATLMYVSSVQPAIRSSGPEGGRFMQRLVGSTKYPMLMNLTSTLTVLVGLILLWMDASFDTSWLLSREGIFFWIGGLAGLIAFLTGFFVMRPSAQKLGELGKQIQSAGGQPTPEQGSEMQAIQKRMHTAEISNTILIIIALLTMATARAF